MHIIFELYWYYRRVVNQSARNICICKTIYQAKQRQSVIILQCLELSIKLSQHQENASLFTGLVIFNWSFDVHINIRKFFYISDTGIKRRHFLDTSFFRVRVTTHCFIMSMDYYLFAWQNDFEYKKLMKVLLQV